jgi:hypothetical protein
MDGIGVTRPLSGGSGCSPIQLTVESELTLGLPRMEFAKCFEQFAFFHFCSWGLEPHSITFKQARKH